MEDHEGDECHVLGKLKASKMICRVMKFREELLLFQSLINTSLTLGLASDGHLRKET